MDDYHKIKIREQRCPETGVDKPELVTGEARIELKQERLFGATQKSIESLSYVRRYRRMHLNLREGLHP